MGNFFKILYVQEHQKAHILKNWLIDNNITYDSYSEKFYRFYKNSNIHHCQLIWFKCFKLFSDDDYIHTCCTWLGNDVYLYPKDAFVKVKKR